MKLSILGLVFFCTSSICCMDVMDLDEVLVSFQVPFIDDTNDTIRISNKKIENLDAYGEETADTLFCMFKKRSTFALLINFGELVVLNSDRLQLACIVRSFLKLFKAHAEVFFKTYRPDNPLLNYECLVQCINEELTKNFDIPAVVGSLTEFQSNQVMLSIGYMASCLSHCVLFNTLIKIHPFFTQYSLLIAVYAKFLLKKSFPSLSEIVITNPKLSFVTKLLHKYDGPLL